MLGFINIYKPSGLTSSNVVVKLRKKFHIDKIGHFGTLDPMACGVLPIAIGKATRMFDYYLAKYKTYIATFQFGYITDTLDAEGNILDRTDIIPKAEQVSCAISKFLGTHDQVPPNFSAKLVNGVRAYTLARNGETVELKPKQVKITKFDLINQINDTTFVFEIICSSGTYIRSIARDLGYEVGSLCTMIALERTQSGIFNIENSINLKDALDLENIESKLISVDEVFPMIDVVNLKYDDFCKIRNGVAIANLYNVNNIALAKYDGQILGIVEKLQDKLKLKTYLME